MYKHQSYAAPSSIISLPRLSSMQSCYVMHWFLDDLWARGRKNYSSEALKVLVAIFFFLIFGHTAQHVGS